jgi:hypothetical protein
LDGIQHFSLFLPFKVLQKAGGDAFIEDKLGHTPFYYRTHGKRLNIRTLKDNAVR